MRFFYRSNTEIFLELGEVKQLVELPLFMEVGFEVIQNDRKDPTKLIAALGNAIVTMDKADGKMTTLVGVPAERGYQEGNTTEARFDTIKGIIQTDTSLVLLDSMNNCLRKMLISAEVYSYTETYCGECGSPGHKDSSVLLDARFGVTISMVGESAKIYVLELSGTLRLVHPTEVLTVRLIRSPSQVSAYGLAIDPFSGYPIIAQKCALYYPNDEVYLRPNVTGPSKCVFDGGFEFLTKNLIIAVDVQGAQLRVLDLTGQIHATICTGKIGVVDGKIHTCRLYDPNSVLVDENTIYIGEFSLDESSGMRALSFKASSDDWYTKPPWLPTSNAMPTWTSWNPEQNVTILNANPGLLLGIVSLLVISGVIVGLYVRDRCRRRDANAAVQDTAGKMVPGIDFTDTGFIFISVYTPHYSLHVRGPEVCFWLTERLCRSSRAN